MQLTSLEKLFNLSDLRVYFQRKFEAPRVLSGVDVADGGVCIEIGCGRGAGALLIRQYLRCRRLVCVDIDSQVLEIARAYVAHPPHWAGTVVNGDIEFICADASKLSFDDCTFDAAFLFGTLHHIREWRQVVTEVRRVLKPGGVFSFEEALWPDYLLHLNEMVGHVSISDAELRETLEGSGFSIVRFDLTKRFEFTRYLPGCVVRAVRQGSLDGQAGV